MTFRISLKTVSLFMVTIEVELPSKAPVASLKVTVKFSGPSAVLSFVRGTVIVPELAPAAIVRVPDVEV